MTDNQEEMKSVGHLQRAIARFKRAGGALPKAASASSPLDINALLGRRPVNLDTPELQRFLAGKRVLVTGAGGSIGSEICRQTMKFCPERLILLDRAENALFEIDRELRERWVGGTLDPVIADVCDVPRVRQVFETHQPQVVFHAAAHKHVPMMERHPGEAVKNNVFGTKNVADAAIEFEATAFVLISTDKAVNPSSVMGATKRVAELYVQGAGSGQWAVGIEESESRRSLSDQNLQLPTAHRQLPTRLLSVRFGNVLGSSGSVVPIFERQIAAGGPVTVTHAEMTRYFMTIPEASQLVMQAGAIGKGGEIFLLDMGEPVKILDLANEMIRRRGLIVGKDIEINFSGIRPGEKLFEELSCADETTTPTSHRKIHVWRSPQVEAMQLQSSLNDLRHCLDADRTTVVRTLMRCVQEFQPSEFATIAPLHLAA